MFYRSARVLAVTVVLLMPTAAVVRSQTDRRIASIRAEVNLIEKNARRYEKKVRSVEGISLEGTEATYFLSGRGSKKITAKMYGETFRATAELYYSGEEMIFAYQRVERYNGHIAMKPPPKVAKIIETRVYYAGGKAIRIIEGKKQVAAEDAAFAETEKEMSELSTKLKDALGR